MYQYEKLDRLGLLISDMSHFELQIGNTFKHVAQPNMNRRDNHYQFYKWKVFVRLNSINMKKYLPFMIEKVLFKPPKIENIL